MLEQLRVGIQQVVVGADRAVELLLVALPAGGHVLLDDVPGTGKTTLAKTLARALDCSFRLLQFTLAQRLPAAAPSLQRLAVGYGEERYGGSDPALRLPALLPDWRRIIEECRANEPHGT